MIVQRDALRLLLQVEYHLDQNLKFCTVDTLCLGAIPKPQNRQPSLCLAFWYLER